jgi:hypothetical protein
MRTNHVKAKAVEINLLEQDLPGSAVEVVNNTFTSYIRYYQLKTLRVSLQRA